MSATIAWKEKQVRDRVEARRWAEECYAAAEDKGAFAERVAELNGTAPRSAVQPAPMTDQEARAFETECIQFGFHSGKPIGDLPLSYLARLTDPSPTMQEFLERVRRYLRNSGVRRMMEDEQ